MEKRIPEKKKNNALKYLSFIHKTELRFHYRFLSVQHQTKNCHSKTYIRVTLFTLFCRELFGFFLTFGQLFDIFGASFRHLLHQHVIRQQSTSFI